MTVYGLTGKTGAGKSTVAAFLKEKGFYIIDGDIIARHITDKGKPALTLLADYFGADTDCTSKSCFNYKAAY